MGKQTTLHRSLPAASLSSFHHRQRPPGPPAATATASSSYSFLTPDLPSPSRPRAQQRIRSELEVMSTRLQFPSASSAAVPVGWTVLCSYRCRRPRPSVPWHQPSPAWRGSLLVGSRHRRSWLGGDWGLCIILPLRPVCSLPVSDHF